MNILEKIRSRIDSDGKAIWLLFFIFVFSLFVKTMMFHWTCFHSISLSALWKAPLEFFMFWGGKIAPMLFVGGLLFFTKKHTWTIIFNFLLDVWIIANLFYFRANGLFLSIEVMFLVNNLEGFWDSLYTYMSWDILWYIVVSCMYVCMYSKASTQTSCQCINTSCFIITTHS